MRYLSCVHFVCSFEVILASYPEKLLLGIGILGSDNSLKSLQQKNLTDNKQYAMEVRSRIFIKSFIVVVPPRTDCKYSFTSLIINFALTALAQDVRHSHLGCLWFKLSKMFLFGQ